MNKKAQIPSAIAFIGIVLVLLFLAPILLKIVVAPLSKTAEAFTNVDTTNKSVEAIAKVQNTFTGTFDWFLMFLFIFNVMLLLITSFMIDVHPAFLIVYIIALFCIVLFAPTLLTAIDGIYENDAFAKDDNNVVQYLPMINFVRNNFTMIIVGILIVSGIIMYGKFRFSSGASSGGWQGSSY